MRPLLLLFLLPLVFSQPLEPSRVFINVYASNKVTVAEQYIFPPEQEANLTLIAQRISSHYFLWKNYVEGLEAHVCKDPLNPAIVLKTEEGPELLLTYECNTLKKLSETLLFTEYELSSFVFPVKGGLLLLPGNTMLTVRVEGEIVGASPEPTIRTENTVAWSGPLTTAIPFSVRYRVPKVYTAPSITAALLSRPDISAVLALLLVLLIALRKRVRALVADVVSHFSEIKK